MAKKKSGGPNKSQAIRDYDAANPGAKAAEVAAALSKKGMKMTAQYVNTVRFQSKKKKKASKRGRPAGSTSTKQAKKRTTKTAAKRGRPAAPKTSEVSLDSLIKVKQIVDEMGGIDGAKQALAALEQLMD